MHKNIIINYYNNNYLIRKNLYEFPAIAEIQAFILTFISSKIIIYVMHYFVYLYSHTYVNILLKILQL